VLALTFTNKASREMKERIASLVGYEKSRYLWMGTFHSIFIRFLREYAHLIGFPASFTIYDTADTKSAIRNCLKELSLDDKIYKPGDILSRISRAKNNLVTASAYLADSAAMQNDAVSRKPKLGEIYALYSKRCRQSGAMDFDDILLYTNILIRDFPEALESLRSRFSFILVDEFQDTNKAQWLIVRKLAYHNRNLCVVGDDSQSIYAFRGAKIENILNFKKDFPEAKEFRLEQNYRSTQIIVNAANSLIANNPMQLKKECFSNGPVGEKIEVIKALDDRDEALEVASSVLSRIFRQKSAYSEFAILYRTNAQSRSIEEALRKRSIPYRIYGGFSFYERAEVKDMMAFLRLLLNPDDNEAFRRAVKASGRGIGDTTIARLADAAVAGDTSMWGALRRGDVASFGIKSASFNRLEAFCSIILEVRSKVDITNAYDIAMEIFIRSGYATILKSDTSLEGQAKVENVEELFNSIKTYVEERTATDAGLTTDSAAVTTAPLGDYLETISLMSAIDEEGKEEDINRVSLMTVHSAKGLEFTHVYIVGLEENLFPSFKALESEPELEEERRLMYVALTRARNSVTILYAQSRLKWGSPVMNRPSRFIREIHSKYLNWPALESSRIFEGDSSRSFGKAPAPRSSTTQKSILKPPSLNFVSDPISKLKEGQKIEHDRFGFGKIFSIEGNPIDLKAIVDFEVGGRKILLLKYAKLRVVK